MSFWRTDKEKKKAKLVSRIRLFATLWTVANQAPLCRGKNARVSYHFFLQRIFPTKESNPCLPHCDQTLYPLSHQGILAKLEIFEIRIINDGRINQGCLYSVSCPKFLVSGSRDDSYLPGTRYILHGRVILCFQVNKGESVHFLQGSFLSTFNSK